MENLKTSWTIYQNTSSQFAMKWHGGGLTVKLNYEQQQFTLNFKSYLLFSKERINHTKTVLIIIFTIIPI